MTPKTVPLARVFAPSLAEVLADSIAGDHDTTVIRKAAPDLLERFCRIAEAPDTARAVVAFARRWGVLGLCEHGLPYRHCVVYGCVDKSGEFVLDFALDFDAEVNTPVSQSDFFCRPGAESFQHWKEFAVRFDSLLRIGLDLNRGKLGSDLDWQLAETGPAPLQDVSLMPSNIDDARERYESVMEWMIQMSQLQPSFHWSGGGWNIDLDTGALGYSNIPAILTAQLMLRVGSAKKQIKCLECPRWFIPRRNQRKYCDHCGIQAAWRVAQRKRRG
jgi:hypothetical protein